MFRILQAILWLCCINGFTKTAYMDLEKTQADNDVLASFIIGVIRTSRQSFKSHMGIGSTVTKALDDLLINCLISVSVKC